MAGGSEEGGWSYTHREKFRDIQKSFSSNVELQKWISRIKKAMKSDELRHDSTFEAHVFKDAHGPEEFSDPSDYS